MLETRIQRDDRFCMRTQLGRKACDNLQQALLPPRLRYGWGDFREMILDGDALWLDAIGEAQAKTASALPS